MRPHGSKDPESSIHCNAAPPWVANVGAPRGTAGRSQNLAGNQIRAPRHNTINLTQEQRIGKKVILNGWWRFRLLPAVLHGRSVNPEPESARKPAGTIDTRSPLIQLPDAEHLMQRIRIRRLRPES
jgi:hypothetical protein